MFTPFRARALVAAFVLTVAGLWPVGAEAATECINPNVPAPLEICVQDSGSPGVWLDQGGSRVNQYYGDYSWASNVALAGTSSSAMYGTWGGLTPVSNTLTGSGTTPDPFVITTVLTLGASGVQLEQKFTYVNGDRYFKKRWTLRNSGASTYSDVRFFHGGDTYFGGDDSARAWYNPSNRMVYVSNSGFTNTGYMGFYASPVTPSSAYFGGHYSTAFSQMENGQLSSTADSNFLDAGYALQWNRATLAPGQTWIIEAFETWSAAGSLQVLSPSDDAASAGTTVRRTFAVQNLHASTASGEVALTAEVVGAPLGWSAALVTSSPLASLAALARTDVELDITIPAGAAPGTSHDIRLTADPDTAGVANGVGAFKMSVLSADVTITPNPLQFGLVLTGTTATRDVIIANAPTGTPLRLGLIGDSNPLAAPFSIVVDSCSGNPVAPGASCVVTVAFHPTSGAIVSDTFDVAILEPVASLVTVSVEGNRQVGGTFTVTPSAGAGGSLSPATAQVVAAGTPTSFTVTPATGHLVGSVSGCGGSLSGSVYTTGDVNTDCTVRATFYAAPIALAATGGDQFALLYNPFASALAVAVTDANGTPVEGAVVTFAAPVSGATAVLSAASAVTNAQGRVSVTASANGTAGAYTVSASALGATADFALTNVIQPTAIAAIGGTPQSAAVCTPFGTPLSMRVRDINNLSVANVQITFSVPGTGASAALSAMSAITDGNGEASITATANTNTGSYSVTATVPGIAPATFDLTNSAGTPCTIPDAPTGIVGTPGDQQASISWTAPASDGGVTISNYQVTVSPAPTGGAATRSVGPAGTSFVFTNLANGTAYTFVVRAINSVGAGPNSAASDPVTPASTPNAPANVAGTAGDGQVIVTWTAPVSNGGPAVTGYQVQVATSASGPFENAAGCPANSTTPSCTATGLTNGTAYFFRVSANNAAGTGSVSTPSAGVTPGTLASAPGMPTAVGGDSQATITVAPPASGSTPTSYTVTATIAGVATSHTCTVTGVSGSCSIAGLSNGTTYRFTVTATSAAGTSPSSLPSNEVTPIAPPPQALSVVGVEDNAFVLMWEHPASGAPPTAYEATVGTAPGRADMVAPMPTIGDELPDFVTGYLPRGIWYVRLRAMTGAQPSAYSNEVAVFIGVPVAPTAPVDVRATPQGRGVQFSWTATYGGGAASGMRMRAWSGGSLVGQQDVEMTEHVFVPDVPVGVHTFTVSPLRGELEGPASAAVTVNVGAPQCTNAPAVPTRFRHVVQTGRRVGLLWFPPADETAVADYIIHVTGSWTGSMAQPLRDLVIVAPPGTYHVTIYARNACGVSPPSAVRTIVVP